MTLTRQPPQAGPVPGSHAPVATEVTRWTVDAVSLDCRLRKAQEEEEFVPRRTDHFSEEVLCANELRRLGLVCVAW